MTTAAIGPSATFAGDLIAALYRFLSTITQPNQDVQETRRNMDHAITIANHTANLIEGIRRGVEAELDEGIRASALRGVWGDESKSPSESIASLLAYRDSFAKTTGSERVPRRQEILAVVDRLLAEASAFHQLSGFLRDAANARPTPEMLARAELAKSSPGMPLDTVIAEFRADGLL